jgi:hypothetical protein
MYPRSGYRERSGPVKEEPGLDMSGWSQALLTIFLPVHGSSWTYFLSVLVLLSSKLVVMIWQVFCTVWLSLAVWYIKEYEPII